MVDKVIIVTRLIRKRFDLRSFRQILSRSYGVIRHYGFSGQLFKDGLARYMDLMSKYDITPTFPVTATVVKRNPDLFHNLVDDGVELAIHGYKHVDYTDIPLDEFQVHLEKSCEIFKKLNIPFSGYRFPYLRKDTERINRLREFGFQWDSSDVLSWNSWDPRLFSKQGWK